MRPVQGLIPCQRREGPDGRPVPEKLIYSTAINVLQEVVPQIIQLTHNVFAVVSVEGELALRTTGEVSNFAFEGEIELFDQSPTPNRKF